MQLPEIVGIAGTNGSGKDTLGHVRARLTGAKMVSLSDILRKELDRRAVPHERENLRALSAEWRSAEGSGVLAIKTIEDYQSEKPQLGHTGLSIVSLRHPDEATAIKDAGGFIVWVDADPRIRYDRIQARGLGRPEDQKTFEEFVAEEAAEMDPAQNTAGLNMGAVRALADRTIVNEFDSVEAYEAYLIDEFELHR